MPSEDNRHIKRPPRGPHAPAEKPKDFKNAIKRLFMELKSFRMLIYISLVLAALGSILSLIAPDKLSDLTDEISKGLIVNVDNLEDLSKDIASSLDEENIKDKLVSILNLNLDQNNIIKISSELTVEDRIMFNQFLNSDSSNLLISLSNLPDSVLEKLYENSNNGISTSDKIELIRCMAKISNEDISSITNLPDSIKKVLFEDSTFKGVKITADDKLAFLTIMSQNKSDSVDSLYSSIDLLPNSIKSIVEPNMNIEVIKKISLILVILYLCSALFTYIQSISMTDVANKSAFKLRGKISVKINKLPLKYFDNHPIGDILSRVTNDVDTIAQSMNQSLATLVSSITLFVGSIIMMFITNWIMAITAIISSLLGFVLMFVILGKSQKYFTARQVELGNLNSHIEEIYSGLNVVKVYNGKKEADRKFDELNKRVYDCNRKSQFLSGLMQPIMGFIGNFGYVAVCIVGAILTMNDITTFGVIVAFIMYVRLFTSPLSQIAQAMTSLQSTAAASERVFEFIDEKEMSDESHIKTYLDSKDIKGEIEFNHVEFKYDGNDLPTIKDFSAKALKGQKIAIVGPTGAGKTTMVNLLMKFYEINSGDIKIDNVSINDLTRENIHNLFTMVLQDTWLFDGTIKENIVYNRKGISDDMVIDVCKKVGLDHFIKTLPDGYDSKISDNDSISAGQRQLLTIARGMLENTPFLILDEATSNVDTRTEELVSKAMDQLMEGRTSFVIAHRLSTIKNADLILVMKDGDIIEAGNHDELISKNGFYAELYNSQFELGN